MLSNIPKLLKINLSYSLSVHCFHSNINLVKTTFSKNFNPAPITGENFIAIRQGEKHF